MRKAFRYKNGEAKLFMGEELAEAEADGWFDNPSEKGPEPKQPEEGEPAEPTEPTEPNVEGEGEPTEPEQGSGQEEPKDAFGIPLSLPWWGRASLACHRAARDIARRLVG